MQHDREYMLDILDSAKIAISHLKNKDLALFKNDLQCQDAVIRRLEIIGEAARRISDETREKYPDLPWSEMIGMRNFMIHEYDDIDLNVVWETISFDLPPLVTNLEKIMMEL